MTSGKPSCRAFFDDIDTPDKLNFHLKEPHVFMKQVVLIIKKVKETCL